MFFSFHCIKGFSHCNISEKKSKICSPKQLNQHDFSLQSWCNFFKLIIVYVWNSSVKLACVEIAAKTLLPSISWTLYPWPRLKEPQKLLGLCAESFLNNQELQNKRCNKKSIWNPVRYPFLYQSYWANNYAYFISTWPILPTFTVHQASTHHPPLAIRKAALSENRETWSKWNFDNRDGIHMMNIRKYPPGNTHLAHQTRKG